MINIFKVFVILTVSFTCSNLDYKVNINLYPQERKKNLTKVFLDVIEEFYVKNSVLFDIFVYRSHDLSIFNEIGMENLPNFSNKLIIINERKILKNYSFSSSALIITQNVKTFNYLNHFVRLSNKFPKSLTFLVFLNDATDLFEKIINSKNLSAVNGRLADFEFIFYENKNVVELITMEHFAANECNKPSAVLINSFDKITQKWQKKLKAYKKHANFHNCRLFSGVVSEIPSNFYLNKYSNKPKGLMVDLFVSMGQYANFKPCMKKVSTDLQITSYQNIPSDLERIEERKQIHVLHEIKTHLAADTHVSMTFLESSFIFLITPGEPYTVSEKLFLPFDEDTWIWLTSTFAVTFFVIVVLNKLPQKYQDLVYGEGITTPTLNIVFIFFGLGQMKVPEKWYPRFLLMSFIVFCLIFRTCYQSKLFEFMTTDMRKLSPETIDDLYYQNFTIVTIGYSHIMNTLENMMDENKRWVFLLVFNEKITKHFFLE